ncbi:hypothetical protein KR084_011986 [Drosophila pseudotakahashii]|nr:hypothetical protein KR084_011986 [Drosophila pseudotakahashii]
MDYQPPDWKTIYKAIPEPPGCSVDVPQLETIAPNDPTIIVPVPKIFKKIDLRGLRVPKSVVLPSILDLVPEIPPHPTGGASTHASMDYHPPDWKTIYKAIPEPPPCSVDVPQLETIAPNVPTIIVPVPKIFKKIDLRGLRVPKSVVLPSILDLVAEIPPHPTGGASTHASPGFASAEIASPEIASPEIASPEINEPSVYACYYCKAIFHQIDHPEEELFCSIC